MQTEAINHPSAFDNYDCDMLFEDKFRVLWSQI